MKTFVHIIKNQLLFLGLLISLQSFATIHAISVQNFSFTPATIPAVNIGDTIRWNWVNGSHTTTSTAVPSGASTWDHPLNSGSTTFDYIPTVPGEYAYKCTPHLSMGMTGSFTVSAPSMITVQWKVPSVRIFTNPMNDQFAFRFNSESSYLQYVKIYDLTGQLCKQFSFEEKPFPVTITIDLPGLRQGIYLFEFIDNNDVQIARRVIKQ